MIRLTLKVALASSFLFVRVAAAAHLAGNEKSRSVMEEFLPSGACGGGRIVTLTARI